MDRGSLSAEEADELVRSGLYGQLGFDSPAAHEVVGVRGMQPQGEADVTAFANAVEPHERANLRRGLAVNAEFEAREGRAEARLNQLAVRALAALEGEDPFAEQPYIRALVEQSWGRIARDRARSILRHFANNGSGPHAGWVAQLLDNDPRYGGR